MLFINLTFPVAGEWLEAIIFSMELSSIIVDRQKRPDSLLILDRQLKSHLFYYFSILHVILPFCADMGISFQQYCL